LSELAPIIEELVFRGCVMGRLSRHIQLRLGQ
jgi:membrane protease YdiL (CAAX protease family)